MYITFWLKVQEAESTGSRKYSRKHYHVNIINDNKLAIAAVKYVLINFILHFKGSCSLIFLLSL